MCVGAFNPMTPALRVLCALDAPLITRHCPFLCFRVRSVQQTIKMVPTGLATAPTPRFTQELMSVAVGCVDIPIRYLVLSLPPAAACISDSRAGDRKKDSDGRAGLRFPRCFLVLPNLHTVARLSGGRISSTRVLSLFTSNEVSKPEANEPKGCSELVLTLPWRNKGMRS